VLLSAKMDIELSLGHMRVNGTFQWPIPKMTHLGLIPTTLSPFLLSQAINRLMRCQSRD
jgi:hypothetical protein